MTRDGEAPQSLRVASIGLGRMGAGLAHNILRAGFPLTVYNRTPEKAQALVKAGAAAAGTPSEAVAEADVVISSLNDDQSVFEVSTGDAGTLDGMKKDAIHIETSTLSPETSGELAALHAKQGTHYVAGPVLGRPDVARAGRLVTFLGGEQAVVDRCRPVIDTYTGLVLFVSEDHGLANVMKLCANYMAISVADLMGQIFAFGEKAGIDSNLLKGLFDGAFAAPGLKEFANRIHKRDFNDAGFDMAGGLKDIQLILETAEAHGVTLEYAPLIREKMRQAIQMGLTELDWTGAYEVTRERAGLE